MRKIYYEIGTTFCYQSWNGGDWSIYEISVIENKEGSCKNCAFKGEQKCREMNCSKLTRKDNINVIFKKRLKSITNF